MTTPAASVIVWQPPAIRAYAHEVATAASELREITPLLRALAELRVPAGRARQLQDELARLLAAAGKLQAGLELDVAELWAAVGRSTDMEQRVTAILTQRPHPPAAG